MIKYVVVMFVFPHRLYQVQSITTIQNCFWCRLYLLDQSRCCPIQFSSLIALDQISLNSSVWVLTQTRSGLIDHDSSVSFLAYTASIQSVMQLSYKVFIIVNIRSDRSQKFNIVFYVDCICMIRRVLVLSGFHHTRHPIRLVMIIHDQSHHCFVIFLSLTEPYSIIHDSSIFFRCRSHLYDMSHRCPIWFSSQTTPNPISCDNSISFSVQNAPV